LFFGFLFGRELLLSLPSYSLLSAVREDNFDSALRCAERNLKFSFCLRALFAPLASYGYLGGLSRRPAALPYGHRLLRRASILDWMQFGCSPLLNPGDTKAWTGGLYPIREMLRGPSWGHDVRYALQEGFGLSWIG